MIVLYEPQRSKRSQKSKDSHISQIDTWNSFIKNWTNYDEKI